MVDSATISVVGAPFRKEAQTQLTSPLPLKLSLVQRAQAITKAGFFSREAYDRTMAKSLRSWEPDSKGEVSTRLWEKEALGRM